MKLIFSELENITREKRTNVKVGSSGFISLNPLNMYFYDAGVPDVLMSKQIKLQYEKSTVIGAVSGAFSFGVGSMSSAIIPNASTFGAHVAKAAIQATGHGFTQGVITGVSGGDFIRDSGQQQRAVW